MKKIATLCLGLVLGSTAFAQNDVDALRYSFVKPAYTAKGLSVGGAVGALGADISASGINPAGMAQYKSGEAVISFSFDNILNNSTYLGQSRDENSFKARVPSVGLVFTHRKMEKGVPATNGWVNVNFGMNMGQIADYNRILSYGGNNASNSLLDYFAERSNGIDPSVLRASDDEFDHGFNDDETMAWESYLIDYNGNNTYVASIDPMNRNIRQKGIISTTGGMHEINFSLAANYSNKLYLGGALSVKTVKFEEDNKFSEINDPASAIGWNNYTYERHVEVSGTGVSGVLGLIYRPDDRMRFGVSYHTPTNLNLEDNYSSNLQAVFDSGTVYNFASKQGYFSYEIQTPSRTTLSAAYLFGKKGFISADFEGLNYSTMRLRPSIDAFEVANDVIRTKYAQSYNMRLGGEFVSDMLRFRAGYAYYSSPFKKGASDLNSHVISAGMGIKEKSWGMDLGVVRNITNDMYQPYVLNNKEVPVSTNTWSNTRIVLSLTGNF